MIVNYCFHVFGATVAELDAVSCGGDDFEENAYQVGLKNIF